MVHANVKASPKVDEDRQYWLRYKINSGEPGSFQIAIETWQAPVKQVQEVLSKAQPVWIELGQMIVIALVVIAILLFLRSLVSKHDVKEVVPEAWAIALAADPCTGSANPRDLPHRRACSVPRAPAAPGW